MSDEVILAFMRSHPIITLLAIAVVVFVVLDMFTDHTPRIR